MTEEFILENEVGGLLKKKQLTVAVAESCTGGLVGHRITSVGGSSEYFVGGVIAYSNEVKKSVLGVENDVLEEEGAVSESVAMQMAQAVRIKFESDIGVSITGIAGPGGGTEQKPVGLVFVGLAAENCNDVKRFEFGERSRTEVKWQSSVEALEMLKRFLKGDDHGEEI